MTAKADIDDFLAQKRFAFVGVSHHSGDFSRQLFREFRNRGYEPVPVNPVTTEIEGTRCFANVGDIQPPVDSALLMTSATISRPVAEDCVAAGVKRIWFYRAGGAGAVNAKAIEHCRASGLRVIPGECPFMFFTNAGLIHRVHGWVRKIRGAYPG
jgi:predicted CoA-binding protein